MSVIVTDGRTEPDQADSLTGWTGTATPQLITSNPAPVELTGSVGMAVGTSTNDVYFGIASTDLSAATLIYVWILANGAMDTLVNGGSGILLYDGTDRIGFHLSGSDKSAFRHNITSPKWECLCLDTANLPANATARAGVIAQLTLTAITGIGSMFKTLSKALGGGANCFTDVIRYGNQGLTITGGTTGAPGTYKEIAAEDESDVSGKAYGIISQVADNVFDCQGAITHGGAAAETVVFRVEDGALYWKNLEGGISTGIYKIVIQEATGSTEYKIGLLVGSGDTRSGSNGFNLVGTIDTPWEFDASDIDVEKVLLYGGVMAFATDGVTFSDDATNAPNHDIAGWIFQACAQVVLNRVPCRNTIFGGYSGVDAALLWNANIDIKNCSFNNNTDGSNNPAAIEHDAIGTFSYTGMKFSGNDFDILNSVTATTEDSYSETNQNGTTSIGDTVDEAAMTFIGAGGKSSSCWFYLKKTGSPTGNAVAKIYSVTGTPGSGATPNALLATSDVFDVSTLTGSYALVKFNFYDDANQITLVNTTDYFISLEYTGGSAGNVVDMGHDITPIGFLDNIATFAGSWTANNSLSICYYVSTGGIVIVNATDSDPATFINSGTVEGIVDIRNTVNLTVTVFKEDGVTPLENAQTSIHLSSDNTELMNKDTNVSGVATESYKYLGDVGIVIKVRKSEVADNPRWFPFSKTGTITSDGLTLSVTMEESSIV